MTPLLAFLVAALFVRHSVAAQEKNFLLSVDFSAERVQAPFFERLGGPEVDVFKILAENGVNNVRFRLWVNPVFEDNYASTDNILELAKRAHNEGLSIYLDFHYSDSWADPGQQTKPRDWAFLNITALENHVYDYTSDALKRFVEAGVNVEIVSVGNEITNGFLWSPQGQPCDTGGYIWCFDAPEYNWPTFARLMSKGIRAVRDIDPNINLMIHTDLGNHPIAQAVDWYVTFTEHLSRFGETFDTIGLSWYPQWAEPEAIKHLESVRTWSELSVVFPNKQLIMAEVNYPFRPEFTAFDPVDFPFSMTGQRDFLEAVIKVVENELSTGTGISWWGAERQLPYESHALFDDNKVPTLALLEGFHSS